MNERMKAEVALLRRKYAQVDHGPEYEWFIVREVAVAEGWNRKATDVLFLRPSGYPETPPDNFWVPAGLLPTSGPRPNDLSPNARQHEGASWDQFSWHIDSGWSPTAKPEEGSNLLDFMREVERRLSEVS